MKRRESKVTRRRFLQFSLLGIVGCIVAACTPKPTPTQEAPTAASVAGTSVPATDLPGATAVPVAQKAELRWLDWSDQDDCVDLAIAAFKEKYPSVTVKFEPIVYEQWGDKELTQMISGTAPDVLAANEVTSYVWAERGQLLDLNPLVDRDLTEEQVGDFVDYQWKGLVHPPTKVRMGLPYYVNLNLYFYNQDALEEAGIPKLQTGWTMDDYDQAIEKLTQKDASGKVTRWGASETDYDPFGFQTRLRRYGGHLVDPEDLTHCVLASSEAKEAIEWYRHRLWDTNTLAQPMQTSAGSGIEALAQGKAAIAQAGNGVMFVLIENPPAFQWASTVPPVGPTGKVTALGTLDNWGIWKGTKAPDIAWDFARLLSVGDVFQLAFMRKWSSTPSRKSLLPKFKEVVRSAHPDVTDEQIDPQIELLEKAYVEPYELFKKHKASLELLNPLFERIFIVGDTGISAIDQVADEVTALNREG